MVIYLEITVRAYPEFKNMYYFRMSGFRSQLSDHNKGFPAALSDYAKILFNNEKLLFNEKSPTPKLDFVAMRHQIR